MPPKIVTVPKTPTTAFNPNRPAGKLLLAQTQHLREALIKHLEELATVLAIDVRSVKTEGEVSAYIQRATAILHQQGVKRQRK
jgi:uncharacterized protein YqgV (UPF0045/DUF77 family)